MAYIYLLNLYEEIEKRIDGMDPKIPRGKNSKTFEQGRYDLLKEFEQFLVDNMNSKLPKRIRKRMSVK